MDNVGTVPASMATFLALQKMTTEAPDKEHLLINAGTYATEFSHADDDYLLD